MWVSQSDGAQYIGYRAFILRNVNVVLLMRLARTVRVNYILHCLNCWKINWHYDDLWL